MIAKQKLEEFKKALENANAKLKMQKLKRKMLRKNTSKYLKH